MKRKYFALNLIIASIFQFITYSTFAQPTPYLDQNFLNQLVNIHGVQWKNILSANSNDRSQVRSKLKEILLSPNQYYPNDPSNAKLAYTNALVGYGQFASRLSNDSTRLTNDAIDFYKSNLDSAFARQDEELRKMLYSSLRFTGSVDALEILHDALNRESSFSIKLDLLEYARDILSDQNELGIANNILYTNLDTFNLTPDFTLRGKNDNWEKSIDKFIGNADDVKNNIPAYVKIKQQFIQKLNAEIKNFEKAKQRAIASKTKIIKQSNNTQWDSSDDQKTGTQGNSKVSKNSNNSNLDRRIASDDSQDESNASSSHYWYKIIGFLLLLSVLYYFRKKFS